MQHPVSGAGRATNERDADGGIDGYDCMPLSSARYLLMCASTHSLITRGLDELSDASSVGSATTTQQPDCNRYSPQREISDDEHM